jgi:hypothetical protein
MFEKPLDRSYKKRLGKDVWIWNQCFTKFYHNPRWRGVNFTFRCVIGFPWNDPQVSEFKYEYVGYFVSDHRREMEIKLNVAKK